MAGLDWTIHGCAFASKADGFRCRRYGSCPAKRDIGAAITAQLLALQENNPNDRQQEHSDQDYKGVFSEEGGERILGHSGHPLFVSNKYV